MPHDTVELLLLLIYTIILRVIIDFGVEYIQEIFEQNDTLYLRFMRLNVKLRWKKFSSAR